jgi:DNA-directed RNA polymerase subunit RPC12/RpoP
MESLISTQNQKHICHICNKEFETKGNLDRHLNRKYQCVIKNEEKYKCSRCGKIFNKKCNLNAHLNKKNACQSNEILDKEKQTDYLPAKEEFNEMLRQQGDMIKLIMTMNNTKNNADNNSNHQPNNIDSNNNTNSNNTQNINANSNNTNSHNTQNNTMNSTTSSCLINYVVNQYPNAKNIEDCIKIENIPKMTLTECEDLYFTDGAMKIFKGLCDLGEENRPIHCTDASRCNYIYKSNDVWKIDIGGEVIRNHFFPVIQEAYTQVHKERIKNNPGNSTIIGNYLTEMTGTNVKKICQKTLKRLSNDFFAKNSKNSKLIESQKLK